MAIRKIKPEKQREPSVSKNREIAEIIAFRKANAAFADNFFAMHNISGQTPSKSTNVKNTETKAPEQSVEENAVPDFSFAKQIVESYHDNNSYISDDKDNQSPSVISESQIEEALEAYRSSASWKFALARRERQLSRQARA